MLLPHCTLHFLFFFNNCIVPKEFLLWEIRVAFPRESQLRQSHATQPIVHAGCLSVSIIHRTLTWTTDYGIFNAHTDVNVCHCTWACTDTVKESALKVDSERKFTFVAPRNRTCISGVPVRRYTNWATSPPSYTFRRPFLFANPAVFFLFLFFYHFIVVT